MLRKKNSDIEWLEFELLQGFPITHGITLRKNSDVYRLQKALNVEKAAFATQVHDKKVEVVREQSWIDGVDGLITDTMGLGLAIRHADCQAAIFYDPTLHLLANVHSGWRGNVKNIYKATVEKMKSQFGVNPAHLLVCISPSLGPSHSEFINYKVELPDSFMPFQHKPYYFDLWAIAKWQLLELGISPHHIEIANMCTYTHSSDFFSYRRDRTLEGQHTTLAMLQ